MEVRIQGIHFDVTRQLTDFINKKADKLGRRYESISFEEAVDLALAAIESQLEKEKNKK